MYGVCKCAGWYLPVYTMVWIFSKYIVHIACSSPLGKSSSIGGGIAILPVQHNGLRNVPKPLKHIKHIGIGMLQQATLETHHAFQTSNPLH